jgi:predicted permease
LTRFVFSVAIPAFLFHLMADFSSLPAVDARLLIAYFGGCLVVFAVGRVIAATVFRLRRRVAVGVRDGRNLRQQCAARPAAWRKSRSAT